MKELVYLFVRLSKHLISAITFFIFEGGLATVLRTNVETVVTHTVARVTTSWSKCQGEYFSKN